MRKSFDSKFMAKVALDVIYFLPKTFAASLAFRYSFRLRACILSGVFSIYEISYLFVLEKHDKGIAHSLYQSNIPVVP